MKTAGDASKLTSLLKDYIDSDPRLHIWRQYPDISEDDDNYTDRWACQEVSTEFVAFARARGWDAALVHAEDPEEGLAFDHYWVRLTGLDYITDVDWTARQYHNLFEPGGRDPNVLSLPWPLAWAPHVVGPDAHLIVGRYATITLSGPAGDR
jgi:hypothetical protein